MKLLKIILLGLLLTTAFSCYEKEEGCLDSEAVNFDVTADEDCCCEYSKLVLGISHAFGDKGLIFGDTLFNNLNSPFKILGIQYYLSNFSFIDDSNNLVTTIDRISLPQLAGNDVETIDDFILMTRSVIRDSIGFFPTYGSYDKLQFEIGVKDQGQNTNPENMDASHPLSTQTDTMWYDTGNYVATKIILKPDTAAISDTITLNIFENTLVELESPVDFPRGAHASFNLRADYAIWFRGVDFQIDDETTIKNKIKANLASSLSFY